MALIEIKSLTKLFGSGIEALKSIDLDIDRGEFVILCGRNGSGKTVLIKHIVGLLKPTGGTVRFDGRPVAECLRDVRRRIGIVFQNSDSQIIESTVERDILFGLQSFGYDDSSERIETVLDYLDLRGIRERSVHTLSGGEKKRTALAGVLVLDPDVIIFDEPFVHLDYPGIRHLLALMLDLHSRGRTILIVTHDVEKTLAHATRLVVMNDGRIVASGPGKDLLDLLETNGIRRPAGTAVPGMSWLS